MEVKSTSPGVQLYTSNFVDQVTGKGGAKYQQRQGLCLETQYYPSSINVAQTAETERFRQGQCFILRKGGEPYRHTAQYIFGTNK